MRTQGTLEEGPYDAEGQHAEAAVGKSVNFDRISDKPSYRYAHVIPPLCGRGGRSNLCFSADCVERLMREPAGLCSWSVSAALLSNSVRDVGAQGKGWTLTAVAVASDLQYLLGVYLVNGRSNDA